MIDEFAKAYLHNELREIRAALLWKLDGLCEYDARRPLTPTGTNLLGLVKHRAYSDARYLGEIFDRPLPGIPRWNEDGAWENEHWATQDETRETIVALYQRVWNHTDATISTLPIDAPGHVPWWPNPDVKLFNCMVHVLNDTTRHAGHADILREQLDGAVGTDAQNTALQQYDAAYWADHRAKIEQAAKVATTRTNG
jgi:Protein of unknown function (DUF664)